MCDEIETVRSLEKYLKELNSNFRKVDNRAPLSLKLALEGNPNAMLSYVNGVVKQLDIIDEMIDVSDDILETLLSVVDDPDDRAIVENETTEAQLQLEDVKRDITVKCLDNMRKYVINTMQEEE